MECTEVLNIIGNIASIITVVGGIYGFCKWVSSRKAAGNAEINSREQNEESSLFVKLP